MTESGFGPGDWFRHSDVHIFLVAPGWILGSSALLGRTVAWPFLLLASLGAFLVYRVDRLLVYSPEDALNAYERVRFTARFRVGLVAIAVFMTIAAVWAAFHLELEWIEVCLVVGLMGLVYPLRIFPGGKRPKDVPWFKTLLIAGCWVGGGVLLPALMPGQGKPVDWTLLVFIGIYRLLFVLPNLLVADWLDRVGDARASVTGLVKWIPGEYVDLCITVSSWLEIMLLLFMHSYGISGMLLALEGALCLGMANHAKAMRKKDRGDVTLLDLWVASPIMTWLLCIANT